MTYLTMSMKGFLMTFQLNLEGQTSYCQVNKQQNKTPARNRIRAHDRNLMRDTLYVFHCKVR